MEGIYEPKGITEHAKRFVKQTSLGRLLRPRSFQLYCVGTIKTGTTSIASLFAKNYRSWHEPWSAEMIQLVQAVDAGTLDSKQIAERLKKRDLLLRLECESSHVTARFCNILAQEFPMAKFILTVREPRAWLDSAINECLNTPLSRPELSHWKALLDIYFGPLPDEYAPEEEVLGQHRLYSVDGFLSHWAKHNSFVLETLPSEKLLVTRTRTISQNLHRIAAFAGVPAATLDASKSHSRRAPQKHGLVDQIEQHFLDDKIAEHCSETIDLIERLTSVSLA